MSETNKKFKIVTLGCRTNQYESQAYQDQLEALGYRSASEGEAADLCIVNTCTVTESADSSSRHEIRQLARQHAGCQVSRHRMLCGKAAGDSRSDGRGHACRFQSR